MWLQGASWAGHEETPDGAPGTWEATGSTVLNEEVCVALERKDRERQTHVPSCTAGSRPDSWGDPPQGLQEGPGFLLGESPESVEDPCGSHLLGLLPGRTSWKTEPLP